MRETSTVSDYERATAQRKSRRSCLPLFLALAVVIVVVAVGLTFGRGVLRSLLHPAPDYPGPGSGSAIVRVHQGDTSAAIGQSLVKAHVVKSTAAFTKAAVANPKARDIQVGYYKLRRHMKASAALAMMINPKSMVHDLVVVPEGSRLSSIVDTIAAKTSISKASVEKVLANPGQLGLPSYAHGNPEGYLFPATYDVAPHETALQLVRQMVAKGKQEFASVGLVKGAKAIGYSPGQVVTMASILEYEANRPQDYPKVARVFYNRLAKHMALDSDATVAYAAGVSGDVWTSNKQRASSSPYNTYKHAGLPPGPIGSPGLQTLRAAMHPAKGSWLYFLPDFEHHTTLYYTSDNAQRRRDLARIQAFCQRSSAC